MPAKTTTPAKRKAPAAKPARVRSRLQRDARNRGTTGALLDCPCLPPVFAGNREDWLAAVLNAYRPDFSAAGAPLPPIVKVACGFSSHGLRSLVIGECWVPEASAAGVPEVFIVPRKSDSIDVGSILVHELVHAAGIRGHGADFRRVAVALGMEGKMTATVPGVVLRGRLREIIATIGDYPHAELDPRLALGKLAPAPLPGETPVTPRLLPGGYSSGPKTQTTRMLKVTCDACPCVLRMTRTHIDGAGLPTCGCGSAMSEG